MAALSDEVKMYVVQALACYDRPSTVIESVKHQFGLTVTAQQLAAYDPKTVAGKRMSAKLKAVFDSTREAFLKDVASIPIAKQSVRLRALDRMAAQAEKRNNLALAAQLHEQAAKEVGNVFTNRQKLEHSAAPDLANAILAGRKRSGIGQS